MTREQIDKFLYEECEQFNKNLSLDKYEEAIQKYLMLCGWNYTKEAAKECVRQNSAYIKRAYSNRQPISDTALDIGYCCG